MDDAPYAEASGSLMNELITHIPHSGVEWDEDNSIVSGIVQEMVCDTPTALSLKIHQCQQISRGAY